MEELYTMRVPDRVIDLVRAGKAVVDGGVVRNLKGPIVAHMEQVGPGVFSGGIPDFGNPLSVATSVIKVVQNQVMISQNAEMIQQLGEIKEIVQGLQVLSWVNIALTTVNIGVTIAGFVIIAKKLDRLTQQLQDVDAKINQLGINELRKLSAETMNFMKDSRLYLETMHMKELTDARYDAINLHLNHFETHIEGLIDRYQAGDYVQMPFEQVFASYTAYVQLLKAFMTSMYLAGDVPPASFVATKLESLQQKLLSSKTTGLLHDQYIEYPDHLFTEREIKGVLGVYKGSCEQNLKSIQAHQEILQTVPKARYLEWREETRRVPANYKLVLIGH